MFRKFFRSLLNKETKFGLQIGQEKNGMKNESWLLISNKDKSIELFGYGDLSLLDMKMISEKISEGEMFVFGFFGKTLERYSSSMAYMKIPCDEVQGIIIKGKRFQVTERTGISEYPVSEDVEKCLKGEIKQEQIRKVEMIDITVNEAAIMIMEFIKS